MIVNVNLRLLACLLLVPVLLSCGANKKNRAKLIIIVNQGKAKVVSSSEMNNDPLVSMMDPWQSGAVALFRTTETAPSGETGKAGEAYVIDENKKLKKIREFDPTKSDEALQAAFAYY